MFSIFGKKKDEAKVKKIFGVKFVWHKKYLWEWLVIAGFWGVGRSLFNLYIDHSPNVILNFVKGGLFMAIVILVAGFWEGNPSFFEGNYKGKKKDGKF